MVMTETLGEMIRRHREAAGLSRVQLAKFSGVGRTAIYELESDRFALSLQRWLRILEVLNIRVSYDSPLCEAQ